MSDSSSAGRLRGILRTSFAQGQSGVSAVVAAPPTLQISQSSSAAMVPPAPITPMASDQPLSTQDKIDLFDQILHDIENEAASVAPPSAPAPLPNPTPVAVASPVVTPTYQPPMMAPVPQAVPLAVQQVVDAQRNPVSPTTSAKESIATLPVAEMAMELPVGVQTLEQERNPELGPEVEGFLQRVEDHHEQHPQEIVVADGSQLLPTQQYMAQPVVVLPITPEIESQGKNKSTKMSVRWLVEWSRKIMKMFSGKVIYHQS